MTRRQFLALVSSAPLAVALAPFRLFPAPDIVSVAPTFVAWNRALTDAEAAAAYDYYAPRFESMTPGEAMSLGHDRVLAKLDALIGQMQHTTHT